MHEPVLNCGKNGDVLCAVRKGEYGCPYFDNENCHFFTPDSSWTHPSKRSKNELSSLSLDTIAENLKNLSQEYLDGALNEKSYRLIVMAFAFSAMKMSPRQAESMLNAAKMDIVIKQLDNLDMPAIIASVKLKEDKE